MNCENTYDKEILEKLEKEIQRQFLKNKNKKKKIYFIREG